MYIVFYLTIIVLYFLLKNCKDVNQSKKIYIYSITIILCSCTGLRHLAVGNDTYSFYNQFNAIRYEDFASLVNNVINSFGVASNNDIKDPGYSVISWIAYYCCCGSWEVYQFLVALLILSAIGYLMYKYVPKLSYYMYGYALYISLFYHYLPNSATRQAIALGLFLWCVILWIDKGKRILPIIMLLLASTIHQTVLITLISFVLIYIKKKEHFALYAIIAMAVIFFAGSTLASWMASVVKSEHYAYYGTSGYYDYEAKPINYILQILALFLISCWKQNLSECSKMLQFIIISFYCCVVFAPLILVDPNLIRLSAYFGVLGVIYVSNIISLFSSSDYKRIIVFIVFALTLGRPLLSGMPVYRFNWEYMQLDDRYYR